MGQGKKDFLSLHPLKRDVSSVGLEHRLDRAGVVGSNPSHPTTESLKIKRNQLKPPLPAVLILHPFTPENSLFIIFTGKFG
jgi:hypothetical protein